MVSAPEMESLPWKSVWAGRETWRVLATGTKLVDAEAPPLRLETQTPNRAPKKEGEMFRVRNSKGNSAEKGQDSPGHEP